jgi:hypothetical protein
MDYSSNFVPFVEPLGSRILPLGIHTEFAANFCVPGEFESSVPCLLDPSTGVLSPISRAETDIRRVRYRLQRVAHNVLGYKHRIGFCHRGLGHDSIGVHIRNSGGRHSLGGLAVCANAWVCPVCATRIASRRADEVRDLIKHSKKQGLIVEMVTLTVPHGLGDSAKFLSDSVTAAWRSFTAHGSWKRPGGPRSLPGIKPRAGVQGYVRALEVTHGFNGWHPHLHIIFISENGLMQHRVRIWELWSSVCVSLGLGAPSLERGVDIQNGDKAGEYLCKFSDDGELLLTRQGQAIRWDVADELTLANKKSGKNGSRKPHQILADAEFNHHDILLFREFAEAFKGKSQLQWTPGLKKWAGIGELTDAEIAESQSETDLVFMIPTIYWKQILKTSASADRRSTIIRLSETGGVQAVANYLSSFVGATPIYISDQIIALTYQILHPEG